MKKYKREDLIDICAQICLFAQSHSHDEEAWGPRNSDDLWYMMQHTSYTVACFISQNTPEGGEGVEWEIVQEELVGKVLDYEEWVKVITAKVDLFS